MINEQTFLLQETGDDEIQPDSIEAADEVVKEQLVEEVQEIIASAKEIAFTKLEAEPQKLEKSSPSPDDKKTSDKQAADQPKTESQPDEKLSGNVESGATTTAPTLPEDERIPLDEIKESEIIEEKYVKEDTKESEVPADVLPRVFEPLERATPPKLPFETQNAHLRDIVKTPDEVADLPVHEEAEIVVDDESHKTADKEPQAKSDITLDETETTIIKTEKPAEEVCDKVEEDEAVTPKLDPEIIDEEKSAEKSTSPKQGESAAGSRKQSVDDEKPDEQESRKASLVVDKSQEKDASPEGSRKASLKGQEEEAQVDDEKPASRKQSVVDDQANEKVVAETDTKSSPPSRKESVVDAEPEKPSDDDQKAEETIPEEVWITY